MKKYVYSLMACMCLLMQSCLFSEEEIFDKSSAQRENEEAARCLDILQSAPNGWMLEYYFGFEGTAGACNLFAKFEKDKVTLASDVETVSFSPGDLSESMYKVEPYQGIQLSFNTYNELIHAFCEPNGYNDPGFSGDYEFIIRELSDKRIVMTGKKGGVKVVMSALDADLDWTAYLQAAAAMETRSDFGMFRVYAGENVVMQLNKENRTFFYSTVDEGETVTTYYFPFIFTPQGIKLNKPMAVEGKQVQFFTWDDEQYAFIADEDASVKIAFYCPEEYYDYLGTYELYTDKGLSARLELKEGRLGKTYTATVFNSLTLTFDYDLNSKCINVMGQSVGTYRGYPAFMYVGSGNNFMPTFDLGFIGTAVQEEGGPLTVRLKCTDPSLNSMFFLYNNGGWYLFGSWTNPVMKKVSND